MLEECLAHFASGQMGVTIRFEAKGEVLPLALNRST
jgi:hypothetical protein